MHPVAQRIAKLQVSPASMLAKHAHQLRLTGRSINLLSSGELEFSTPGHVVEAAVHAASAVPVGYGQVDGTPELKDAIQRKYLRESFLRYDADEIIVCGGSKQVMFNAFMATVDRGDEVIVPAPYWASYLELARIAEAAPIIAAITRETAWKLTAESLESVITKRTRWVVINNPVNPSGAVYSGDEMRALADVLKRHPQVLIMSDDLYEHIIFDGIHHVTMAQVAPELSDRTLTVSGVSKTYAMMGWRIGYGAGPKSLISDMIKVQSQSTSGASIVSQAAAVAALNGSQKEVFHRRNVLQNARDIVVEEVSKIDGVCLDIPKGTFYAYLSCPELVCSLSFSFKGDADDRQLARFILDETGVATLPGADCGLSPFLRINFACDTDRLLAGLAGIRYAADKLRAMSKGRA